MSKGNDVAAVLQQYAAETGVYSTKKVERDFLEVAQQVPAQMVTNGLSEALRSEQTIPFEQVVGQSFEQVDSQQRAGMLKQLLDGAEPDAVQPLLDKGVLGIRIKDASGEERLLAVDAAQVHPDLVQQLALELRQLDPAVIDKMSSLFAEDPDLLKTLDGATLSVALNKIAENR